MEFGLSADYDEFYNIALLHEKFDNGSYDASNAFGATRTVQSVEGNFFRLRFTNGSILRQTYSSHFRVQIPSEKAQEAKEDYGLLSETKLRGPFIDFDQATVLPTISQPIKDRCIDR
jgi:hypothetical protein